MKGELNKKLVEHGFMAAAHVAGNSPMSDRLIYTWSLYEESEGNMFVNALDGNRVFTAPKILVKAREYKG